MSSDPLAEFAARIEEAIKIAGGVAPLARAAGVSRGSIDNWRGGSVDPSLTNILAVSEAVGLSAEWLFSGSGPMLASEVRRSDSVARSATPIMEVPRYNAAASAGHGAFVKYAEKLDYIPFTADFMFKRLGRLKTDGLIIVDAAGDSMEPTIGDGDLIMIDTDKKQLTAAIYAFTFEDSFYVKRLNNLPDAIKATSDNKEYDPFIIEREQMNRVDILGRVVWVGHTP